MNPKGWPFEPVYGEITPEKIGGGAGLGNPD
jgi:hypothetical protein